MLELKEYQKEASEIIEDKFNSGINRTSVIWPTGLGKTIVPMDLMNKHQDKKFLVIAPRHSIISQTKEYMEENDISKDSASFYTYVGLSKMSEELMSKLEPDYIVLDEMHRIGAQEWGKGVDRLLEKYPEAKVLGLTATPTRMDGKNMVEEKFNSDIAHEITLEEAIARGLLKMPKSYINAIYSLDAEIGDIEESISRIKDEAERQRLEEKLEILKRKLKESKGLPEVFAERMSAKNGKYIIFCKDIAHMHEMMEKAKEMFKGVNENIDIYDISSEKSNLQNEREIKRFKENNSDSLKLLYSIDMFNEGLHIENTGIIMFRPTASWIIYLQQLGRTLGIEESGEVFDIVNNSKSSKDIYQFYKSVKGIQRKEKIDGVDIDFTIYDELRDIQELLEEINESIHRDMHTYEEKIAILKKLQEEGIDLSTISTKYKTKDGENVGTWLTNWRKAYDKGSLSEEEIEGITNLGIVLEKQREARSHDEKIATLKKLQEEGIDLSTISQRYKTEDGENVGTWLANWRTTYNRGTLSEEEIEEITNLGIVLERQKENVRRSHDEKIATLKKLQEEGIDWSTVSRKYKTENGENIGIWINNWKIAYYKGALSQEKIEEIEKLGIVLKKQREDKSYEEKIAILKKLKEEQGGDLSTISNKTGYKEKIVHWIDYWRRAYNAGELSEEEIKDITDLGIVLERQIERKSHDEKIATLKKLHEQGMDLSTIVVKYKTEDGESVGEWINYWRKMYKNRKLSQEEIDVIEELGIKLSLKDEQKEKEQAEAKLEQTKQLYAQYKQLLGEKQKENGEK